MRSRIRLASLACTAALSLLAAACGGGGGGGSGQGDADPGTPQRGGELIVLEEAGYSGAWPSGLDPATNTTGGANLTEMNAIFGGLFQLGEGEGENAEIIPKLASGYELSEDGKTATITLREGVQFSDGTPFNAEAVAWNFKRNSESPCTCNPRWPLTKKDGIVVKDEYTVELNFTRPYPTLINRFPVSNVNWVASPTAFEEMGEDEFKQKPVGAGPFKVVSNTVSSELVLERNPNYFEEGKPYLDKLTFKAIGGDQAAYQAILAGQAHAYEGMTTTPLVEQARNNDQITTTIQPATSPYVVQLNTKAEPFNDKRAREAIYYATDPEAINKGLFNGWYPISQSFTGPGGLFHQPTVPGYRTYDLEKAKQIVQDMGGLEVELGTLKTYVADQVNKALQSQWEKAGIDVTIHSWELSTLITEFESKKWQAMLQTAGSWDPEAGVGVPFRFRSDSPFTGVFDPKLDKLLNDAAATLDEQERAELYAEAGKYISDEAYAPFLFAFAPANIAAKGVHGPGLTTKIPPMLVQPGILWEDVWMSQQ